MRAVQLDLAPGLGPGLRCALALFARTHGLVIGALLLLTGAAALLALGLFATVVHELGHITAYRVATSSGEAIIECDGLRAALHRMPLTRRADRAVTAAGPLAPLLLAAAFAPLAAVLPAEAVAAVLVAIAHAASLGLPSADRRAWRQAQQFPVASGGNSPTLLG
jgi:hypothetical protein